jgi:hypothetical protein
VEVSIPDISAAEPGDTIRVPVEVSDLTGAEIGAFEFSISYDPVVISFVDSDSSGTIASGMLLASNAPEAGLLKVGAASAIPISGAGTLMRLEMEVLDYGNSTLEWTHFLFSGVKVGEFPEFQLSNGSVVVDTEAEPDPADWALAQNYPNPFRSETTIEYALTEAAHVTIEVYDALGRVVATLVDERQPSGQHEATLNAGHLANGVYFYQIEAEDFVMTREMVVVR